MMKRCVIVGAGELYAPIRVKNGDLVIAADGGYTHLLKAGIKPDVLIGDFDSLDDLPNDLSVEIIRHPVEKDETDMYLAYRIGVSRGCLEFHLYGGVGGREDHTFANYCLLTEAKNDNNRAYLVGNGTMIFAIKNERIVLSSEAGRGISVFAFGGDAHGVSIKGLKYQADNITLMASRPLGVSNSFIDNRKAEISVKSGTLLIMQEV